MKVEPVQGSGFTERMNWQLCQLIEAQVQWLQSCSYWPKIRETILTVQNALCWGRQTNFTDSKQARQHNLLRSILPCFKVLVAVLPFYYENNLPVISTMKKWFINKSWTTMLRLIFSTNNLSVIVWKNVNYFSSNRNIPLITYPNISLSIILILLFMNLRDSTVTLLIRSLSRTSRSASTRSMWVRYGAGISETIYSWFFFIEAKTFLWTFFKS